MSDNIKLCDVIDNCEDCPRYADDCDGDKRTDEPFRKPLVYNPHTAEKRIAELEAKVKKQADEVIRLKADNTNLRIKCRILETDLEEIKNGKST